jgi:hypothetical protein
VYGNNFSDVAFSFYSSIELFTTPGGAGRHARDSVIASSIEKLESTRYNRSTAFNMILPYFVLLSRNTPPRPSSIAKNDSIKLVQIYQKTLINVFLCGKNFCAGQCFPKQYRQWLRPNLERCHKPL